MRNRVLRQRRRNSISAIELVTGSVKAAQIGVSPHNGDLAPDGHPLLAVGRLSPITLTDRMTMDMPRPMRAMGFWWCSTGNNRRSPSPDCRGWCTPGTCRCRAQRAPIYTSGH